MKHNSYPVLERAGVTPESSRFFARYGLFMLIANLAWEIAHLPLYTLWAESKIDYLAFVVFHCTAGDLMIAFVALGVALILVGNVRRPDLRFGRVAGITLVLGIVYTVYSEWLNVTIRESWAYSDLMPVIPFVGAGVSPVMQWIFLPLIGLLWARKSQAEEPIDEP